MALSVCRLNLNRELKELKPHGTLAFPCAGYDSRYVEGKNGIIAWHWHEELEMIYIAEGQMRIKVPSRSYLLSQGDCIVFNSNVLHYCAAVGSCNLHSLVFNPALVFGDRESVFAKDYIQPLTACRAFSALYLEGSPGSVRASLAETSGAVAKMPDSAISGFRRAFAAMRQEGPGYEFMVREGLTAVCLVLWETFRADLNAKIIPESQDNVRVKKMLEYIHSRFADSITLADIAGAADIGERECLRCFRKTIQLSPIQYLLKYRIMQGADLLLSRPQAGIAEIATLTGFDSPSHFAKLFKRFYNCTPREYRKEDITRKSITTQSMGQESLRNHTEQAK